MSVQQLKDYAQAIKARVDQFMTTSFAGRLITNILKHNTTDQAAMLAYYLFCSFVPFMIGAISMLATAGVLEDLEQILMPLLSQLLPAQSMSMISELSSTQKASIDYGLVALVSVIPLLWSASQYLAAFGRACDEIYEVDNPPASILQRPRMVILLVVLVLLSAGVISAYLATSSLLLTLITYMNVPNSTIMLITLLRYPILLVLMVISLSLLYLVTPSHFSLFAKRGSKHGPKRRQVLPGALVATLLSIVSVWIFTQSISMFGNYDARYGAIAGIIMLILAFWLLNTVFLVGVELNKLLEEYRKESLVKRTDAHVEEHIHAAQNDA